MRFFVLPIFYDVIMDGHLMFFSGGCGVDLRLKYWMLIHYDTIDSEMGKNTKSHLYFHS